MNLTSDEIVVLVGSYFWPFCRIAAFVTAAPIFGAATVPTQVKLAFAILLTVAVAPVTEFSPEPFNVDGAALFVTLQQIIIGLAMGYALTVVFAAFVSGGQMVGQMSGLGFAAMVDPQNGVQVPVVSQFYQMLALLIFLAIDGHLVVIQVLVDSFSVLPVGADGLSRDGIWLLIKWSSWIFFGAVLIALPAVSAMLVVNISFGVMSRASPQLNIFAVGFPFMIILGFVGMSLTIPSTYPRLVELLERAIATMHGMMGG